MVDRSVSADEVPAPLAAEQPAAQPAQQPPFHQLRRLHPVTPILRGWRFVAVAVVAVGQQAVRDFDLRLVSVYVTAVLVIGAVLGAMSWAFTKYRVDGSELRIERGWLFRRSRHIRIDRLQAVDIVRPVLARLFGLAELRLEVAGGGRTEAPLAYLTELDAARLRAELLARAAGLDAGTPEAPERQLVSVPPVTLFAATVLTAPFLVSAGAFLAVAIGSIVAGEPLALALLAPWSVAVISIVWSQFVAEFGFTVSESPDGLRIRKGLLDTWAQTVPPGRVQGVKIEQQLLWRPRRWTKLSVSVAGYGTGPEGGQTATLLLPVAPWPVARALLTRVLPMVDVDAIGRVVAPRRAAWMRPVGWRFLRYGRDDRAVVADEGWLTRRTYVVLHEKIQSVRVTRGPLQRLLRLSTLHIDIPVGPVRAVARHRDAAEAREILADLAERARVARSRAMPERWMSLNAHHDGDDEQHNHDEAGEDRIAHRQPGDG